MSRNSVTPLVLLAASAGLFLLVGGLVAGTAGSVVGLALGLLLAAGIHRFGTRVAMRAAGARRVTAAEQPRLAAIVADLTARAGLPMARLFVAPARHPNAFATGRSSQHAAVFVTQGALDQLDDDELSGALAHELAHANRGVLAGSRAAANAMSTSLVAWLRCKLRTLPLISPALDQRSRMKRLLLVEDDAAIARPLMRALEREDFAVEHVEAGQPAIERVQSGPIDIVVLDLTLPDLDGLDVCRQIRASHPALPIVMLTARREEVDLVVGFDAGADDYVAKPFRVAELVARLRARLRVTPAAVDVGDSREVMAGDVRVDRAAHRAFLGGTELDLTPKEFDLLHLLVGEAGRTVERTRIMREVWDDHWWGPTRTLDMHVSALRRKLGDDSANPQRIVTVRGVGFRLEPL
jgi:DNA-binding response OmpR family regulator